MADFNNELWSWFIAIISVISLVVWIWVTIKLMGRKLSADEQAESMGHEWDEGLHELNNPLPRWWVITFLLSLFWGLGYLIMYPGLGSFAGVLNWTQIDQYEAEVAAADARYGPIFEKFAGMDIAAMVDDQEALAIGRSLFSTYCTTCHGSDAAGARGYPNLTDTDWLYGGEPENIEQSILNGRSGIMMAWGPILSQEDIFNVSEYVRSLSGYQPNEAVASKGKEVFQTNCFACHQSDGTGNKLLGAPNLTDDTWLYGGSSTMIIETITNGRNGVMPPHREFLGEAKVHLLANYVYSLSKQD